MTVELICPYCRFSKTVSREDIPFNAKRAICPRCKRRFDFTWAEENPETPQISVWGEKPVDVAEAEGGTEDREEKGERTGRWESPWEDRGNTGIMEGIFSTIRSVLFSPSILFRTLTCKGGIREPLAFGLLTGAVGNMFSIFWPILLFSGGIESLPFGHILPTYLNTGLVFLITLAAIPIWVLFSMFSYAIALHLMLLIVRGGGNRFEATFRVVAYSQATQIWCLIPVVGSWIAGVWQLVVQVIGLREMHETTYSKVVIAFLIPIFIVIVLLFLLIVPMALLLFQ